MDILEEMVMTTGNILQAGFQYGANSVIEKETGKNTFEYFVKIQYFFWIL